MQDSGGLEQCIPSEPHGAVRQPKAGLPSPGRPDHHAAHYSQPSEGTKAFTSLSGLSCRALSGSISAAARPLFQKEHWDCALLAGTGNREPAANEPKEKPGPEDAPSAENSWTHSRPFSSVHDRFPLDSVRSGHP